MPEIQQRKAEKGIDDQRPFLGLRSFEEKNKSQFGGRNKEIKELYGLDENSVLTVVFGKSGIGKTSLIKAGLIPELRQNFYFPIYVRIDYSSSRTPLEQVRKIVFEEMKKKDSGVPEIGDTTLWEYFHNVNLLDDLVTPVLILDQFEEIFTLGEGKKNVLELLIQLADLAENRIPLTVQSEYQKLNKTVPTHYAEQPYRVILSLREDYLARLEELKKYMPSIMSSRFRVVQMTVGQALEAAIKPGRGLIDERVALEIIKKLPGISLKDFDPLDQKGTGQKNLKVEPFLLSLVCDRLNEKRLEKGLKKITVDLVSKFNVTDVIYSFYTETITPFGENVEKAIEDCLLTEGGFRKLQALEEFQRLYAISDEMVDQLVDARILRKEIRDGVDYVELIHDVLAPIIKGKRSKRARLAREEERQAAIIQAKKKQRARLIRGTVILGVVVALILAASGLFAIQKSNRLNEQIERNTKMKWARDLLLKSQRFEFSEGDYEKVLLTTRLAYQIFAKNKRSDLGEDMYERDFYNAMYVALQNNGSMFIENQFDTIIKSVSKVNEDKVYYGLADGTVLINYPNFFSKLDSVLYKFDKESFFKIDFYTEDKKHLLAVASTFDTISIYDLNNSGSVSKMAIPQPDKDIKSMAFTNKGGLILLRESSIIRWDSSYENPSQTNFPDGSSFTAINFHDSLNIMILGNENGDIYTMSSTGNLNTQPKAIAHTRDITNITVSPDGRSIATADADNTLVIWTIGKEEEWIPLPLKNSSLLNLEINHISAISFTPDGDYVLAAYSDGRVLKWPISADVLDSLICKEVGRDLTEDEWKSVENKTIEDLRKAEYNCE